MPMVDHSREARTTFWRRHNKDHGLLAWRSGRSDYRSEDSLWFHRSRPPHPNDSCLPRPHKVHLLLNQKIDKNHSAYSVNIGCTGLKTAKKLQMSRIGRRSWNLHPAVLCAWIAVTPWRTVVKSESILFRVQKIPPLLHLQCRPTSNHFRESNNQSRDFTHL